MKKCIKWVIFSFVVLFILPLLAAKFAGENGMAICFLLFFAVYPLFFAVEGVAAGKNIKKHWFLPILSAILYLLSMWILFDMGEIAFVMYAGIYLAEGMVVMPVTAILCRGKERIK